MIKIKKIIKISNFCPTQWSGETEDNREVYIRYRWGYLSVYIYNNDEEIPVLGIDHGGGCAGGTMDYSELKALCADKLILPEKENE